MPLLTSAVAFGAIENDRPSVWRARITPARPIKLSSKPIQRAGPCGPRPELKKIPRANRPAANGSQTRHIVPRSIFDFLFYEPLAHGVDEIGVCGLHAGGAHL